MQFKKHLSILTLFVAFICAQNLWAANNLILESYSISGTDDELHLIIRFNQPVSYLSHFPARKGKSLEVKLRPLLLTGSAIEKDNFLDKLPVTHHKPTTLSELKYEQDANKQGQLSIQFTRSVVFSIKPARDRRSLTVIIGDAPVKKQKKSKKTITPSFIKTISTGLAIYTLNLKTSSKPIDIEKQSALKNYKKYDIYTTSSQVTLQNKYLLRLGYFYSRKAANANAKQLKRYYPNVWVDKVKPERMESAESWFLTTRSTKGGSKLAKPSKIEKLLERGKQAIIDKKYRKAIRYFTRILEYKESKYHKAAKELLGLARERNNQFAHAKAEYQQFLKLYPEGEETERVKQRLTGLLTARSRDRKEIKKDKPSGPEPEWSMFGSLSQFYRNQVSGTDSTASTTIDSSLLSDVVYSGRKRGREWNQRFDIVVNHRYDFLDSTDANNGNIYTLFYDISDKDSDFSVRAGRQTHNSDGVLGRFDGFIVRKRIGNSTRLNFIVGYPVEISTKDSVDTTRQFYAASVDFESILENLDGKLFYTQQENSGLTDRTAIGTELQYVKDRQSIFFLLDYDIHFSELNQAIFVGNWISKTNSTLSIVADIRNTPLLTANNAIIGQTTLSSIDLLRTTYTDAEIKQLALDRTADSKSLTVAASTPLNDKYQINGDISISNLGGTPASGGVDATTATGNEYFYNLSLIANGFFFVNDVTIMGLQYSDAATSSTLGLNLSTRFKTSKPWRWNPRFSISQRSNDSGSDRMTYKARVIVNYTATRDWRYELEVGYESSETSSATVNTSEENYYIFLGYIHDF